MRFRNQKSWTDEELVAHFKKKGDLKTLGTLYERYLDLLYGVCMKYLKSPESAEDAVMDIFEQLPEKVKKFEIKTFRSWVYVLAKNHCLMALRKKEIILPMEPAIMQSDESLHPLINEIDQTKDYELKSLKACIKKLPEHQRTCIELFYLQGHSYQEIAEALPLNLGKVRSHIQNGRRNLKNCITAKMEKTPYEADE